MLPLPWGQLLHMWSIISLSSSLSVPCSSDCPDLISSSSLKMGSLHCSFKGAVLYFMSLVFIGVRELLTTSQSLAIQLIVLPVKVLQSSLTSVARQRTLLFLQVPPMDSMNFMQRLHIITLGCVLLETCSIRQRCVSQGRLKTFLTVTFQDEKILVTSLEKRFHKLLPQKEVA